MTVEAGCNPCQYPAALIRSTRWFPLRSLPKVPAKIGGNLSTECGRHGGAALWQYPRSCTAGSRWFCQMDAYSNDSNGLRQKQYRLRPQRTSLLWAKVHSHQSPRPVDQASSPNPPHRPANSTWWACFRPRTRRLTLYARNARAEMRTRLSTFE